MTKETRYTVFAVSAMSGKEVKVQSGLSKPEAQTLCDGIIEKNQADGCYFEEDL